MEDPRDICAANQAPRRLAWNAQPDKWNHSALRRTAVSLSLRFPARID